MSVEGKIVLARYGHGYRGIKAKLAEEHKAAALIIYSDPQDDGYVAGDTFPNGPWRPMSGIQRGSIMYTQIYPGRSAHARTSPPTPTAQAPRARRRRESSAHSHDADQRAGCRRDSRKPRRPARSARMAGRSAVHVSRRARRRAKST